MAKKVVLMVLLIAVFFGGPLELLSQSNVKNPMDEYIKAFKLIGQKKYDQAIDCLEGIIAANPDFHRAYARMSEAYAAKNKIDAAISFFKNLTKQNKSNAYAYYGIGYALKMKKLYHEAIKKFERCIEIKPNSNEAYIGLIRCYKRIKTEKRCENYLKDLIKKEPTNAGAYCGLGYIYLYHHKWEEGLEVLNRSIEMDPTLSRAYFFKGQILFYSGRYEEAIEAWTNESKLARKKGDIILEAATMSNLATVYYSLGYYEKALINSGKALKIVREVGIKEDQGQILGNLGIVYSQLNKYEKALEYFEKALLVHKEINNKLGKMKAYSNLGAVYIELGNYKEALKYNEKAISLLKGVKDRNLAIILDNNGSVYFKLKNYKKSLEYYLEALNIFTKINDKFNQARLRGNIGVLYMDKQNHETALGYFEKALEIHKKIGNKNEKALALVNIGGVYLTLGNYEKSEKYFKDALQIGNNLNIPKIIYGSLVDLGRLYKVQKKYGKSFEYYRSAINAIESVRDSLRTEENKNIFFQKKIGAYETICNILFEMHLKNVSEKYATSAFNYIERAKARTFLDILFESQTNIHQGIEPDLLNLEKELNREYAFNQTQLQIERSKYPNKIDIEKIKKLKKKLESLNEQFKTLRTEMIRTNSKYAQLKYPEPITLNYIQRKFLNESTVLLEYMVTDKYVIVLRIMKDDFKAFRFPISREELQTNINLLREGFNMLDNRTSFVKKSFDLYQQIVEPVLKGVLEGKTLLIVPDDILHYLPFEALLTSNPGKKKNTSGFKNLPFLIKKYPVHYVQSASVLASLRKEKASKEGLKSKELFAMGDPYFGETEIQENNFYVRTFLRTTENRSSIKRLRQSGIEVENIGKLFHKKDIFLRENAKEELVKPPHQLDQYTYIHFSTHGLLNVVKPELSGLILAQDKDPVQDGFLQMREIFNLKIDADLVTLSACETGLGKDIRGEGLVGLTRAWMYAGTPSVLVSLWKVDDEATAKLMVRFYKNLKKGMDKAKALQKAKLWLIKQTGTFIKDGKHRKKFYGNPFYWAGFVLIGDK